MIEQALTIDPIDANPPGATTKQASYFQDYHGQAQLTIVLPDFGVPAHATFPEHAPDHSYIGHEIVLYYHMPATGQCSFKSLKYGSAVFGAEVIKYTESHAVK
jgi:hypothetical protein